MEFEVRLVGGIESCFVSLPLMLIQTLQSGYLPPILAIELRCDTRLWQVAWCGASSSSPSSIEIARKYADCIGLGDRTVVKVRVVSNLPKATLVTIEPLTEDDWEVLELNSELAENAILKQVGIVHEEMRFLLWLHGQTVVMFLVMSTFPQNTVVQLVPGTEVAVAPKRRKIPSLKCSDEDKTISKAQLRVQDSGSRFFYKFEENGVKMDIAFTSGAFVHPETAEKSSFSSLQFAVLSPRIASKRTNKMLQYKDHGAEKEAHNGDFADSHQVMVHILLSESVAKGHIMLPESIRLYLGAKLHSWLHVKGCNIRIKKGIFQASLSPYYFKMFQKGEVTEDSGVEVSNSHENHTRKHVLQSFGPLTEMGITDWSVHDKIIEALSFVSSPDGAKETNGKTEDSNVKDACETGLVSLLRVWCLAQLETVVSISSEDVRSLAVGNKTLLHFKVKDLRWNTHGKTKTSIEKISRPQNQAEELSIDVLYILSLSEESEVDKDMNAYELSFDKSGSKDYTTKNLDAMPGKVQLGDILFSHAKRETPWSDNLRASISSLNWMGTVPVDVNDRLTALLSPSSGMFFSTYNIPLPGHILICGPPGSGKTLLAKVSAKSVETCTDILAHIVFVSCSKLTLEKPSTMRQALSRHISEALDHAPSLIILDDLDGLIASSSDFEGSQPPPSSAALIEFLADILDEYEEKQRNFCGIGPIAFIATVQSLTNFPQRLCSSGRFDFHVNLPVPAATERSAMLRHEIERRSLHCADDILSDIASKCDGYDAYDLEILVDRSVHSAIAQSFSCDSRVQGNEDPTLVKDDFLQAMQNFLPVAMRDITKPATEGDCSGWEDVGGLDDIRNSVKEMIELPSKFPNIFGQAPLRMRSNVLLYGPPGCGKTHIVGAAASACSLRFISVKGPELLNKYIGASEQAVRDIFSKAAAAAPCLLFFDEFDSIAPKRGHDNTGVTDRVVNQFLTELDGVEVLTGVFVFAATSRPDLLDAALLRPGRLDRLLFCDFPSHQERFDILKVLSRKLPMGDDVDLDLIARMTDGFSGADLQALLSDAQLEAVHELLDREEGSPTGKMPVITGDLLKVIASEAKPSVSEAEKHRLYVIYSHFLDSKRSRDAQSRDAKGKRATLA